MSLYSKRMAEQLASSWHMSDRDECRARMKVILELAVELDRIKKINRFAIRSGESLIEHVILGDWVVVRRMAGDDLRFAYEERSLCAEIAPLWATFVALAEKACDDADARKRGAATPEASA
jgi:hypothetical protein